MSKKELLAKYLNVDMEKINQLSYDRNQFEVDNGDHYEEYLVVDENEAYDYAYDDILDFILDVGVNGFTDEFQRWILENAVNPDFYYEWVNQDVEEYDEVTEPERALEELYDWYSEKEIVNQIDYEIKEDKNFVEEYLYVSDIVDECLNWDGLAHFLAKYDGKEIDLGDGYFAYRIN